MSAAAEIVPRDEDAVYEIPKAVLFGWIGYEIHTEDVLRFHESKKFKRIVSAPARTSKSYSGAAEMFSLVWPKWRVQNRRKIYLSDQSRLFWIVGPDFSTIKEFDYLWDWLVRDREKYGFEYKIIRKANQRRKGDRMIHIQWGRDEDGLMCETILECKSAERHTAIQGEQIYCALMSEAGEHPEMIYRKYLATRCTYLFLPTTPKLNGRWVYALIQQAEANPDGEWESIHYAQDYEHRKSANPKFDWRNFAAEKQMAESRTESGHAEDDPIFAEQFLGLWTFAWGRVLPFRPSDGIPGRMSHVVDFDPPHFNDLNRFVSVDYGYDHKSVALFWAVMPDETLFLFDEICEKQMDPHTFVREVRERARHWGRISYYVGDPSRPEVEKIMQNHGMPIWDRGSKNALRERAAGYLRLIELLSDDPVKGRPRLFVHARCLETIAEFTHLQRKDNFFGDEFSKAALNLSRCDDDCFDAARYGVQSRPRPEMKAHRNDWWKAFSRRNPSPDYWSQSRMERDSYMETR